MEHRRRTLLETTGATMFGLLPAISRMGRQDDGLIKRGIYRTKDEEPLSEAEINKVQREAVRAYRDRFGSSEPVGVGKVTTGLDFPVFKFQYMIEPDGKSHYWFTGPSIELVDETPTPEETTTPEEEEEEDVVTTTEEEEVVETTTEEDEFEETTTTEEEDEFEETTTIQESVEKTTTTEEAVEETATTIEVVEETTTAADNGSDVDVASRVESVGRYMQNLQERSERRLPTDEELDLSNLDRYAETTTKSGATTTTKSFDKPTTSSPRAFGVGATQESIEIDHPVSQGVFTTETKAGTLHSVSKLALDNSVTDRTAHLIVQFIQLKPKPRRGWEIQSAETVHDWQDAQLDIVRQKYAPRDRAHGRRDRVPIDLGLSGPSASWLYSQPDVTRLDLTDERSRPTWRWRWNRGDPGRTLVTLVVGSVIEGEERAEKGDQVGTVRLGATFRQRGRPPVDECERPWQDCVKPRFALESRYE